jgi:hypothetical protein
LEQRRDVASRIRVIEAELTRIGEVTVFYGSGVDEDGNTVTTEQRVGFSVTPGSSLAKLLQAYVALGGNPFDVSLFLTPDSTVMLDPDNEDTGDTSTQPYGGVVYPKDGVYSFGQVYEGGFMVIKKYVPARVGGRQELEDSRIATRVDSARRWLRQEIREQRNDIEARILKLCDLREQLSEELDAITMAIGGMTSTLPNLDEDAFDKDLSVAKVVEAIDSIFYTMDVDNVPDFDEPNATELGKYPFLLTDITPEEDNTAL